MGELSAIWIVFLSPLCRVWANTCHDNRDEDMVNAEIDQLRFSQVYNLIVATKSICPWGVGPGIFWITQL
jgi:hypothetical protein